MLNSIQVITIGCCLVCIQTGYRKADWLQHKNAEVEMLKKLLDGKLKVMERSNLVKSERYSEKLQRALQKYRNQGITNVEVIEELIRLAYDIKKRR